MNFKCECGHEMFHKATNDKFIMCSKCGNIYDSENLTKVEVVVPKGNVVRFKFNKEETC